MIRQAWHNYKRKFWSQGALRYLTPGGKTVLAAMLFSLHGAISLESPLIQLFAALLAVLAVAMLAGVLYRPRLQATFAAPSSVACGESLELVVRLGPSRRHAFDLTIELQDPPSSWQMMDAAQRHIAYLPSGAVETLRLCVTPTRRGVFDWPRLRVTSTFPWNLLRFHQTLTVGSELVVTPAYQPLAALEVDQQTGGARAEQLTGSRQGGSEDYLGNREYTPGIAVRRWDYCSWARLGRPVVREYQNEGQSTATLVIDTFFPRGSAADAPIAQLEAMLSLAAAISEQLTRSGCRITTLITGDGIQPLGLSQPDQQGTLLVHLAQATATSPDAWNRWLADLEHASVSPGVVLVLVSDWDARRERLCQILAGPHTQVHCLLVADAPPADRPESVQWISPVRIDLGEVSIPS